MVYTFLYFMLKSEIFIYTTVVYLGTFFMAVNACEYIFSKIFT